MIIYTGVNDHMSISIKKWRFHMKWVKPNFDQIERIKVKNTCKNLRFKIAVLQKSFEDGITKRLSFELWESLVNSSSYYTESLKQIYDLEFGEEKCSSIMKVIESLVMQKEILTPVILERDNLQPYLLYGDLVLHVCSLLGIQPRVTIVKVPRPKSKKI